MTNVIRNEKGFVLPIGLMFLGIIAILGATAVTVTTTDLKIGTNYRTSVQSFNDAEAGIQYARGMIGQGLEDETFSLPTTIDTSTALNFQTPSGFNFTLSPITMKGDNDYEFTSTGRSNKAVSIIEVRVKRAKFDPVKYAVFGDSWIDVKNGGMVLSYDSSTDDPDDSSFFSTGEADIGSNEYLSSQLGAYVDGDAVFGQYEDGTDATNMIANENTFDELITLGERIDPDPLGAASGGANDPTQFKWINDNSLAGVGESFNYSDNTTPLTLIGKPGGANYYFTDFKLGNGAALEIDSTNGPVNIYVDGGSITVSNGSTVNANGKPTDLSIFSNTTGNVKFKYNGITKAMIYTPFATVFMMNSGDLYGSVWSNKTDLKNSGDVYFDTSLRKKYEEWLNIMDITSWKEVRN